MDNTAVRLCVWEVILLLKIMATPGVKIGSAKTKKNWKKIDEKRKKEKTTKNEKQWKIENAKE